MQRKGILAPMLCQNTLATITHTLCKHTLTAKGESDRMMRREMFVTIAPGVLDMEALGSLSIVSSAQDPKMAQKTITMRCVC